MMSHPRLRCAPHTLNRLTCHALLSALLLLTSACGPAASDDGSPPNSVSSDAPAEVLTMMGVGGAMDARVAVTQDAVIVASSTGVLKLDASLNPLWAVTVGGINGFRSVTVDAMGRILIIGQAGFGPARIVRLTPEGALDRAVISPDRTFLAELVLRPDGDLMLNDGSVLDGETLAPRSPGTFAGERIIALKEGYLVMRSQGMSLARLDPDGQLMWETTVQLPPANYTTIGLRELSDGTLLAAVSGDVNPRHVMISATFTPQGQLLQVNNPRFEGLDRDGYTVPLQFGAGIQMAARGDETFVSFVANSGGLGSNVRTMITASLNARGEVTDAFFGGGGLGVFDGRIISAPGDVIATPSMRAECLTYPTFMNNPLEDVMATTTEPPASPVPQPAYTLEALSTVTVTRVEVSAAQACVDPAR